MSTAITTGRAGSPGECAVFSNHLIVGVVSPAQQMLEHRKLPRIIVSPEQDRIRHASSAPNTDASATAELVPSRLRLSSFKVILPVIRSAIRLTT